MFPSQTIIGYQYIGEQIPIKELLETSIFLAEKGGAILKEIREKNNLKEKSKGLTAEGVVDPLTEGDLQSHKAIVHGFHHLFPLVTVVSEEHEDGDITGDDNKEDFSHIKKISSDLLYGESDIYVPTDDILIWVDPLDATKEYTESLLEYVTTMVCITEKGVPVAGVIHQPFQGKTFWAWVGHGHSKELSKPETNNEASLKAPRIIVSRSHAGPVNQTALAAFGNGGKIIPAGGAGFKVLSLFNKKADAYIHKTLIKKWDICAGHALLRSFGGRMTTLEGKEISYGEKSLVKNNGGLLATLHNHKYFLEKLSLSNKPTT